MGQATILWTIAMQRQTKHMREGCGGELDCLNRFAYVNFLTSLTQIGKTIAWITIGRKGDVNVVFIPDPRDTR